MNKDKQIDEMRNYIGECEQECRAYCKERKCIECHLFYTRMDCRNQYIAEKLYNAGYRKENQGEWVSVDDRMPEISGKYIVCTKNDKVYQTKFYSYTENKGGHWGQKDKGRSITHWMPLPKPPKMKGE